MVLVMLACADPHPSGQPRGSTEHVTIAEATARIRHLAGSLPACPSPHSVASETKPVTLNVVKPWQLALPATVAQLSRHELSTSLETWSTRTTQVVARVYRDSVPETALRFGSDACAIGMLPVDRPSFRPRVAGGDSIHGARAPIVVDRATMLEIQLATTGRSRFDSLVPVVTSARRIRP
jgi:hypothetical protein